MDKKNKLKTGLIFGIAMTLFFIVQDLLTHDHLTTKNIVIFVVSGICGGLIAGLLFGWLSGWLLGKFANSKFVTQTTKIDIPADESISFETGANHFKGIEATGGKLYLTNKRLIFKTHPLNFNTHQLIINLTDIKSVDRFKVFGLVNKGLLIQTHQGNIEKYVVEQIDSCLKVLKY